MTSRTVLSNFLKHATVCIWSGNKIAGLVQKYTNYKSDLRIFFRICKCLIHLYFCSEVVKTLANAFGHNFQLSQIRMRQKYTRVNILRFANFTRGKQMVHANANTHRSIFTYG